MSSYELRRYQRQIMLPEIGREGQERIKKSRVMVVGAGGLGAPVLQYLTAAGAGTICIADDDPVDESNLQRQILYGGNDMGKMKTIIARQRLNHLNPLVHIDIMNIRLSERNILDAIGPYGLVVDTTDNFHTRYLINDACVHLGKPWVFGGIYKFEGQVSVFNYRGGPTLRCIFPEPSEDLIAPDFTRTGIPGITPGIIGSIQACEAIKVILEMKDEVLSGKMLTIDTLRNRYNIITFTRNPDNMNIRRFDSSPANP